MVKPDDQGQKRNVIRKTLQIFERVRLCSWPCWKHALPSISKSVDLWLNNATLPHWPYPGVKKLTLKVSQSMRLDIEVGKRSVQAYCSAQEEWDACPSYIYTASPSIRLALSGWTFAFFKYLAPAPSSQPSFRIDSLFMNTLISRNIKCDQLRSVWHWTHQLRLQFFSFLQLFS